MLKHYQDWMDGLWWTDDNFIDNVLPADPGEFILLAGRTGIGKSTLALHAGFAIATGMPWLDIPTRQGVVGYMALEGGAINLRDRLAVVSKNYPDTSNFRFEHRPTGLNLFNHEAEIIDCLSNSDIIIIDNLRHAAGPEYLKNEYATRWIRQFQKILRELRAVGIVTHHIRKSNPMSIIEPGDLDNLRGAGEYTDAASTVILMERQRQVHGPGGRFIKSDENNLMIHFAKTRVSKIELTPIPVHRNRLKCTFDVQLEPQNPDHTV